MNLSGTARILVLVDLSWYGCGIIRGIQQYTDWAVPCSFSLVAKELLPHPKALLHLKNWRGHGIIAQVHDSMLQTILRLRVPTVNVSGTSEAIRLLPSVATDHSLIGKMAAEGLMRCELRHFAVYGLGSRRSAVERAQAFQRTLEQAGFTCQSYLPHRVPVSIRGWEWHQRNLKRWLQRLPKPVGLLACTDPLGWRVLEAAQEAGLGVPDEIAVVGVGNHEFICNMTPPPLSSVALAPERVGYEAAAMLNRMMAGSTPPERSLRIAPAGIVHRQSSNILALEDPDVLAAVRFIREHADEPIQVDDILAHLPISRRSLERKFQHVLGRSPRAEIRRVYIERAKRLLIETTLPISRVAEAAGFSSATRLGAVFRQQVGMTPLHYRKQFRN